MVNMFVQRTSDLGQRLTRVYSASIRLRPCRFVRGERTILLHMCFAIPTSTHPPDGALLPFFMVPAAIQGSEDAG